MTIFVSDWNMEYWAFYAVIDRDSYEDDISDIRSLIKMLNWRDGDWYIEMVDQTGDIDGFYNHMYDRSSLTHQDILDTDFWEILIEKGDDHFKYFDKLIGTDSIVDLRDAEFMTYSDWDDVLHCWNPDLYTALESANGLGCFDIEGFYNGYNLEMIDGMIVSE